MMLLRTAAFSLFMEFYKTYVKVCFYETSVNYCFQTVYLSLICIKIHFLSNNMSSLQDIVLLCVFKEGGRLLLILQVNKSI